MFDEESGLWTFGKNCPSTQVVDNDAHSQTLTENLRKRYHINIYEENMQREFVPSISGNCNCQVSDIIRISVDS